MNNAQRIAAENRQRLTSTPRAKRHASALRHLQAQREWVEEHGGTLAGYLETYSEDYTRADIKAIYRADVDALARLEAEEQALRPR